MKSSVFLLIFLVLSLGAKASDCGVQLGTASWYGHESRITASGSRYNPEAMTAAHRTLPLGTMVVVTNLRNQRTVTLRITDRGPYRKGRVIDVSHAAARELDMITAGTARVEIRLLAAR